MSMSITFPNQELATKPLLLSSHHLEDHDQDGGGAATSSPNLKKLAAGGAVKYMECLKNHAAAIGGSATDGCGEFMAGGEQGTLEALKCSACNCHRNFHRKIHMPAHPQFSGGGGGGGVLRMKSFYEVAAGRRSTAEEGEGRKRFRTKFSQEQKEKMVRFAERSEWKIQKAGDEELRSFCEEIGITRKVFKVWMHNNKYQFANKTTTDPQTPIFN